MASAALALSTLGSGKADVSLAPQTDAQHLRPRILRRETSQILSYYQSADAGREEAECRYPTPRPYACPNSRKQHRNMVDPRHDDDSSSSSNYSESDTESASDYGRAPEAECGERTGNRLLRGWDNGDMDTIRFSMDRGDGRHRNRNEKDGAGGEADAEAERDDYTDSETDVSVNVQYGIALGSPGVNVLPVMLTMNTDADSNNINTNDNSDGNTGTGIETGYGSRITHRLEHSPWLPGPQDRPQLNLHLTAPRQSLSPVQSGRQEQSGGHLEVEGHFQIEPPPQFSVVDSISEAPALAVGVEPNAAAPAPVPAPGLRRKTSTRGASDKRRVAIVQMDSENEREQPNAREGELAGRRHLGTLSDGYGRERVREGEARARPYMAQGTAHLQQQQQRGQQFFIQPLPSSYSYPSHSPPSAYSSSKSTSTATAASALLARRGIVGTFALLAPADASPSAYTNLGYFTPPLSAPASARPTPPLLARHESAESTSTAYSSSSSGTGKRQHQRSQSEAVLTSAHGAINRSIPKADVNVDAKSGESTSKEGRRRPGHRLRKGSRDIGIVGTSTSISPTSGTMMTDVQLRHDETRTSASEAAIAAATHSAQLSPIFQTPSRSQTSLVSSDAAFSARTSEPPPQSSSSTSKEPKRRSQHYTTSVGAINETSATSATTAHRSPRDENINPVVSGPDPRQGWHASVPAPSPSLSPTTIYSAYYASSGAPSPAYPYYTMATTAASSPSIPSPPTVITIPAPAPSPYLYYQPGIHSTAGPLPSPPRQIIPPLRDSPPPPRPPRLHAPNSGVSSLAKRRSNMSITSKREQAPAPAPSPAVRQYEVVSPAMTPSTTSSTLVNSQSEDSVKSKGGGHTREGAFPINSVIIPEDTQTQNSRLDVKQDERQEQQQRVLKRKNTMDELVKDVTAAIDEAAAGAGVAQKTSTKFPPASAERPPSPIKNDSAPPPAKEQGLRERRSAMDLRREESRSTFKGGEPQSPKSSSSTYSDDEYDNVGDITVMKPLPDPLALSPQPSSRRESQESGTSGGSSKPQKMLELTLKRFSMLPRPPSSLSAKRPSPSSSVSHEGHTPDRSENGHVNGNGNGHAYGVGNGLLAQEQQQPTSHRAKVVYVAKIRSAWPDAMNFADVLAKRSPLERSLGYARKINELANHDPGLGEWVVTTKHNLTAPGKGSKRKSVSSGAAARSPSERSFTFQPRYPSRGSIGSEVTFPKRIDAYVATDLLPQKSEDETLPRGIPPTLPYPTLAHGPPPPQSTRLGASSSTRSNASSLGSGKSTSGAGGFFASIGRKASVKKDRPLLSGAASQPNKLLSKRQQPTPVPAPRPVQINAAPSLPGGPRAPPGRVQRAQSVIAPKMPAPAESETESGRRRSIKRSPSVAPSVSRNGTNTIAETSPDIEAKVGKLADLLPHADKKILAGYLRRAGGMDMVAIGRYLDDEKNRVLIRE